MFRPRRGRSLASRRSLAQAQSADTTFFVTSVGIGNGGDLGGLAGADNHCQTLAQAAGAGGKTWRAYLSTQAAEGQPAVNARDRIGKGPWQNSKGVVIAKDVADLHSAGNNLTKQTALTEKGEVNNGRGDTPNRHDILTGSQPDGTAFPAGADRTCGNWTSSAQGSAMLGHADRIGLREDDASHSWNSSHPSRGPKAAARRRTSGAPAATACSIASRRTERMKIIDAQVHIWSKAVTPPSGLHRKVSSFTAEELLKEMDEAGVDAALIHPPRSWDPNSNALAIEAAQEISRPLRRHGSVRARRSGAAQAALHGWRNQPGMMGLRWPLLLGGAAEMAARRHARMAVARRREGGPADRDDGRVVPAEVSRDRRTPPPSAG